MSIAAKTIAIAPLMVIMLMVGTTFSAIPETGEANRTAWQMTPTPTVDRLAEPTLPAAPSQADYGAQAYWLYCMPCHGDRGQGLTVEFRSLYPPEDRNCWASGCHGNRPYENGFTLPDRVPKIIGPGTLSKFDNALSLYGFTHAAMPFQAPGSLEEDTYWSITAFLLRENGVSGASETLNSENAQQPLHLETIDEGVTPQPLATEAFVEVPAPLEIQSPYLKDTFAIVVFLLSLIGFTLLVVVAFRYRRTRNS